MGTGVRDWVVLTLLGIIRVGRLVVSDVAGTLTRVSHKLVVRSCEVYSALS